VLDAQRDQFLAEGFELLGHSYLAGSVRTMTFDEYHQHRRAAKWFKPADEAGMREFEAAQPEKCPRCGVQVFDPFARRIVIHDVEKCRSTNVRGNAHLTAAQEVEDEPK
jgi:hypothetical protein